MRKVNQTLFGKQGNCLAACIASALELDIIDVPNFITSGNWKKAVNKWLNKHYNMGLYFTDKIDYDENYELFQSRPIFLVMGFAYADQCSYHCCLGRRHKKSVLIVHDPDPKRGGLKSHSCYAFFVHIVK